MAQTQPGATRIAGTGTGNPITEILNKFQPTDIRLDIRFNNNKIIEGNTLTPTQVRDFPVVNWNAKPGETYALLLLDPDVTRGESKQRKEFIHWLVLNIPGNELSRGDTVAAFLPSAPPQGSGEHRYTFLLFKQPNGKINYQGRRLPNDSFEGRTDLFKGGATEIQNQFNLQPVASTFYKASYDSSVDELHRRMRR